MRSTLFRAGLGTLACLWALPVCYAQTVTATVATGQSPRTLAVNPVTNKEYVDNG